MDPQTLADHNLTRDEYERIVRALGREPNRTELGAALRDVVRALLLTVARPLGGGSATATAVVRRGATGIPGADHRGGAGANIRL